MSVTINVTAGRTTLTGLPQTAITDVLYAAPEPPFSPDFGGVRSAAANLLYLHERFPDAIWIDPLNRLVEARTYRLLAALRKIEPGEYERSWPFKVAPKDYQLRLFAQARQMRDIALAPCALGTGKTKMLLDIAADKYLREEIDGLIVIAPNGVHRQWIEVAVPEHLSDAVPRRLHVWKSTTQVPLDILAARNGRCMRIVTFNVEAFSRGGTNGKAYKAAKQIMQSGKFMLVVDESSRIKSRTADRTKNVVRLREYAASRAILTGTPVTKGLEDFFTQYQFLDPNLIGMSNFFSFRNRYCITMPAYRGAAVGAVKIVGYKNQEELIRKIAPVSFMIGSDVLGLPDKRYERRRVDMTTEQAELYNTLRDQLVEDLRKRNITNPANAMVRLLRLQQVLCGRYFEECETEDGMLEQIPRVLPSSRPAVLGELLEEHDGQALIWTRFKADVINIRWGIIASKGNEAKMSDDKRREIEARIGVYTGDTPVHERGPMVEAFKNGELDYMILNPAAGGTGVDGLQACSTSIYYANSFSREHRWQSEGRIHRLGQRNSALYVDLVVPNSIDGKILSSYAETADLVRSVMESPDMLEGDNEETP